MQTPNNNSSALLVKTNLFYGAAGLVFFFQFANPSAWKSFLAGWLIAAVNLELLRRIGQVLIAYYSGRKPGKLIYFLVGGKLAFWGGVLFLLSNTDWLQGIPFAIGTLTIIIAGLTFAFKEFFKDKKGSLRVGELKQEL